MKRVIRWGLVILVLAVAGAGGRPYQKKPAAVIDSPKWSVW